MFSNLIDCLPFPKNEKCHVALCSTSRLPSIVKCLPLLDKVNHLIIKKSHMNCEKCLYKRTKQETKIILGVSEKSRHVYHNFSQKPCNRKS